MKTQNVSVPKDGPAFDASHKIATHDVTYMVNAKMELVCVSQDGMENIVLWKVALTNVDPLQNQEQVGMESVKEQLVLVLILMVIGGRASVTRDGKEMIVVSN